MTWTGTEPSRLHPGVLALLNDPAHYKLSSGLLQLRGRLRLLPRARAARPLGPPARPPAEARLMPKITPPGREPLAAVHPPQSEPWREPPPDLKASEEARDLAYWRQLEAVPKGDAYAPGGPHSFFEDLLTLERARQRQHGSAQAPRFRLGDPGPGPEDKRFGSPSAEQARRRLASVRRDLSGGGSADMLRPSAPGYLQLTWDRAAAQTRAPCSMPWSGARSRRGWST